MAVDKDQILTPEMLLQGAKNDLLRREVRLEVLDIMIKEAEEERKAYLKLPEKERKNYADNCKWNMGQAEIDRAKMTRLQAKNDLTESHEYIKVLQKRLNGTNKKAA